MDKDFILALTELEKEKGIPRENIFLALEKALIKSYEKNFDNNANVTVEIDRITGDIKVLAVKEVVGEVENPITQISIDETRAMKGSYELGDNVFIEITPMNFGRIAAQTARNIVIQKIKDYERDIIYSEYADRERELINGLIQRIDGGNLYVDLGKMEGIVPPQEQIQGESYNLQDRKKFYISEVKSTTKGAQVILSRTAPGLIRRLFELEVPEVTDGSVEIFSISREAGSRTKISVLAKIEDLDPVGACVGFKGSRVKAIVDELGGEKIDIVVWDKDPRIFIANSLSPAETNSVYVNQKEKSAVAFIKEDQLSLAIGKEGQNVRLAARLTGWKIDIKGNSKLDEMLADGSLDGYTDQELRKDNNELTDSQEEKDEVLVNHEEELISETEVQ